MRTQADLFLDAFSEIERYLRRALRAKSHVAFSQLVTDAERNLSSVRKYASDLREFADLRNAIVHGRSGGRIIAEPLEEAVREFRRIADLIVCPPPITRLAHSPVVTVSPSQSLSTALSLMGNGSYSQLPIVEKGYCLGVLTANTITRWLATNRTTSLDLNTTFVDSVFRQKEPTEVHRFLSRHSSVFQVLEAFQEEHSRGHDLCAVLVTNKKEETAAPIGIITVSDLPAAYKLI